MAQKITSKYLSGRRKELRRLLELLSKACFEQCTNRVVFHGTPVESYRRCGKVNCCCNQGGEFRHGPYKSIHTYVGGKQRHISLKRSEHKYFEMAKLYQRVKGKREQISAIIDNVVNIVDEVIDKRTIWEKQQQD